MRCPSVVALVLAVAAASPARAEWTLVWADEGNTVKYDLGSAATNALFHSNTPSLLRYDFLAADKTWTTQAVYKRVTAPGSWDVYAMFTTCWRSANNKLQTDFKMYDSADAAFAGAATTHASCPEPCIFMPFLDNFTAFP